VITVVYSGTYLLDHNVVCNSQRVSQHLEHNLDSFTVVYDLKILCLQCFDTVGLAAGRASSL